MADDYSQFLALTPPWRALDKARFFLDETSRRDANDPRERRAAVFSLDSALVAARGFLDMVRKHLAGLDGWREWWQPKEDELQSDRLWLLMGAARNEGVHSLLAPSTVVHHVRGAGEPYSQLHFVLGKALNESDPDEVRFAASLGITSAVQLVGEKVAELEDLMREVDYWIAQRDGIQP